MNTLAEEILRISEDADKCINYAIGDKLATYMRQQDEQNSQNFALSGVLIFAAAKIFGRKVDCLEQEILGVAKNFEKVDTAENDGEEKEHQKEATKKSRTKKYNIKDGVNMDKTMFEEKEIIVVVKEDINKTLAVPSKISRLQKMKDFFARNKEKSGKIAIPKSMIMSNEVAVTNFGSTQIHDYDDYKDIVGSRRDFTSFSYYINSSTGELQNDLNFSKQSTKTKDYVLNDIDITVDTIVDETVDNTINVTVDSTVANTSNELSTINNSDIAENITDPTINTSSEISLQNNDNSNDLTNEIENFTPPPTPTSPNSSISGKITPINLNLDEGIEMDIDQCNLLMPIQKPIIKVNDILRQSPSLFPSLNVNDSVVMDFSHSVLTVLDEIRNNASDFRLPDNIKTEVGESRMKNIFMIPIKKLKHKCLFDLPDSEFRELKRRKMDQHKSTVAEQPNRQSRIFKILDLLKNVNLPTFKSSLNLMDDDDDNSPFRGFSKEEQNESPIPMIYNNTNKKIAIHSHQNSITTEIDNNLNASENSHSILRKASNDSGYTSEFTNTLNKNDTNMYDSFGLDSIEEDVTDNNSESVTPKDISGADSCYQSLASGQSGNSEENSTLNIPSFMDEFSVKNSTENELEISNDEKEQQASLESEERIQQMKQSAMNVAKWKEFLKPILAQSEKRSKIDMHEYGLRVINKIGNVNDSKTLHDIMEPDQMPAYFFTMLQLTNNRNIDLSFKDKCIQKPTALKNITLTLKSKTVHKEKFDAMGQHFEEVEEMKKVGKRKGQNLNIQTSTPAKRSFIPNESLNFNTPNSSQNMSDSSPLILSQASSGYFSQSSTYSDF